MTELSAELIAAFQSLDTTVVSNAIERFNVRLRNEGFSDSTVRCVFDALSPVIGHAATARIRCSSPPPRGHAYADRTDWWGYIESVPAPRLLVVQDIDERPGLGAFVGEVHANAFKALGCVAYATNGSVRDLPAVRSIDFQLFASGVAVSHAFAHLVDFGVPVTIGGLAVRSGDIVHGDRHGLLTVPPDILADIPGVAARIADEERRIIDFCRSPQFSIESFRSLMRQLR